MGLAVLTLISLTQLFPVVRAVLLVALPSLVTSQVRAVLLLLVITWAFQASPPTSSSPPPRCRP